MRLGDRRLLFIGLVLAVVGVVGMAVQAPGWSGSWNDMWAMHSWMHGSWAPDVAGSVRPPLAGAEEVRVTATEFRFEPDRVAVGAENGFNLTLVNDGRLPHDLTIPELGVRLVAQPGEEVTTGVRVTEPGEYRFLCTIPGHAEAGMVGVLIVG